MHHGGLQAGRDRSRKPFDITYIEFKTHTAFLEHREL